MQFHKNIFIFKILFIILFEICIIDLWFIQKSVPKFQKKLHFLLGLGIEYFGHAIRILEYYSLLFFEQNQKKNRNSSAHHSDLFKHFRLTKCLRAPSLPE